MHKTHFQEDQDLNIKMYTLNLTEMKVVNSYERIGTGENFLNRTPQAEVLRSTTDKWNLMKLNSFCTAMDTISRTNISLKIGKRYSVGLKEG